MIQQRVRALYGRVARFAIATGRAERDISADLKGALAPVVTAHFAAITEPRRSESIQPKHAKRLRLQLGRLDAASSADDMNLPGWRLHPPKAELAGHWAVWVDENWRLTFKFEGTDAVLVDYQDYH